MGGVEFDITGFPRVVEVDGEGRVQLADPLTLSPVCRYYMINTDRGDGVVTLHPVRLETFVATPPAPEPPAAPVPPETAAAEPPYNPDEFGGT